MGPHPLSGAPEAEWGRPPTFILRHAAGHTWDRPAPCHLGSTVRTTSGSEAPPPSPSGVSTFSEAGDIYLASNQGDPASTWSGLGASPILGARHPRAVALNHTAGEAAGTPRRYPVHRVPSSGRPQGQAPATAGWWGRAGGEGSPHGRHRTLARAADTKRGYISQPCSPPDSTPRASTAPLTETGGWTRWHRDRGPGGQAGSAEEAPRPAAVSSWSGLLRFHLTRQVGGRQRHMNELQAPDRRLPRAHANSATWASANTGDRGDTGHGTRNGERGWADGSLERGLLSPTLTGRTGKIRFVLLVKCPFAGYFLSPYLEK